MAKAKPRASAAPAPAASKKRGSAPAPAPRPEPFVAKTGAEALAHFTPAARARYEAGDVDNYNADLDLLSGNVSHTVTALAEYLASDAVKPEVRARVLELEALVLALIVADSRVVVSLSDGAIQKLQSEQRPLRSAMLLYLEVVSMPGACEFVPAERVAAIRAGKGPIDEARDGVNIPALFQEFEAVLRGKHPFTATQFTTIEAKSVALLRVLSPGDAAKLPAAQITSDETKVRDGLWSLLNDRYDEALVVATNKWGARKVYDYVPSLMGRTLGATKAPEGGGGGGGGGEGDPKEPTPKDDDTKADPAKKPAK